MANVNINRSVTDQFYRYKMPRIIAKVEGKGNGIKTVIVNMTEVAKSLQRPPTYPTKYFGCELGAQTQFDHKNERYIVNGAHDAGKLQELLDGFIKRFVLCPECENPETHLVVLQKKGLITQRCIACGYQGNISMRHKLTTFIVKNPPEAFNFPGADNGTTPNKKEKVKTSKKSKKDSQQNGEGSPNGREGGEEDVDTPPEVALKHRNGKADDIWDDEDWGEDTSAAAVKKRMEDLSSAAKSLALSDDLEKTQQERLDLLYEFIKNKKESNSLAGADKEIVAMAEQLDVKDKGPLLLVELLLNDKDILQQIKAHRKLFLRFTNENHKAQKYLLGGFEQLVGKVYSETLMPKVPHVLKMLYDTDILDEEVIIDWDKKVSKKYVSKEVAKEIHERAAPIIKWLKEAEEESESSSEDEVEVVYSHTGKVGTETISKRPQQATVAKDEDDDDLDIDAI